MAPGVISSSWFGFFAPAAVPMERRMQIADALLSVARDTAAQRANERAKRGAEEEVAF